MGLGFNFDFITLAIITSLMVISLITTMMDLGLGSPSGDPDGDAGACSGWGCFLGFHGSSHLSKTVSCSRTKESKVKP